MFARRLNQILKYKTWGDGHFWDFIPSQKLKMAPENLVKVRAISCFWGYFWISNGCRKFSRCRNTMMWVFKIILRCRALRRIKNRVHMTLRSKNIYIFLKIGYKKKIFPPHHCSIVGINAAGYGIKKQFTVLVFIPKNITFHFIRVLSCK